MVLQSPFFGDKMNFYSILFARKLRSVIILRCHQIYLLKRGWVVQYPRTLLIISSSSHFGGKTYGRKSLPFLQINYVKRSSFEFLNWLQFSSLLLQFKKLPCKSLEGICNVAKSQLNFPQFLLEVLNFLLQVSNFLFCSGR
jgi:hypothetical protein